MKKSIINLIVILCFLSLVIFIGVIAVKKSHIEKPAVLSATPVLFYSQQCPHCRRVEAFLKNHPVKLKKLDVLKKSQNLKLLIKTSHYCGLDRSGSVGIPVLWTGKTCVSGDIHVIQYLKNLK